MPITIVDNKGRETRISLMDAMFGSGRTIRKKTRPAKKPNTAKAEAEAPMAEAGPSGAAPSTEVVPPAEAATEAPSAEPATAEAATQLLVEVATQTLPEAATEAATETTNAQATAENKAEEASAVAAEEEPSAEWTEANDQLLMQMKEENKTWKEIGAALPGRKCPRDRYKTLKKGKGKENANGSGTEPAEAIGEGNGEGKGKGKGKQSDGGKGKETAKGKGKEAAAEQTKKYKHRHPHLAGDQSSGDEAGDDAWEDEEEEQARMVIPVEEGSPLNIREMRFLFQLHEFFERIKWLQITSRIWDKTGKRLNADELRKLLGDGQWSDRTFTVSYRDIAGYPVPEHVLPRL